MILKQKIHFIINPISGGINKKRIPALIEKHIDKNLFDTQIFYTQGQESSHHIAAASAMDADIVVAVGGDGTVNIVAQYLVNTNKIFGIIPMGSGNGLAKELNIPLNTIEALKIINKQPTKYIDTCKANNQFFINIAGIGFDAHIANLFAKTISRGFLSYAKIILNELANYKNHTYILNFNNQQIELTAFMICICNGTQFGNNAYIAKEAIYDDGLLEVVIFESFKFWQIPTIIYHLFFGNVSKLKFVKSFKTNNLKLTKLGNSAVNIDGETINLGKEIEFKINKQSLKVIST